MKKVLYITKNNLYVGSIRRGQPQPQTTEIKMAKATKIKFSTVSEWIKAGTFASGYALLESPVKETDKAIAFKAVRFNSCGNPYMGLGWLPKSQIIKIKNDYYTNSPAIMYAIPDWLTNKSYENGISFFDEV